MVFPEKAFVREPKTLEKKIKKEKEQVDISGARREIRLVALRFIPSSNDERVRDKVYRN